MNTEQVSKGDMINQIPHVELTFMWMGVYIVFHSFLLSLRALLNQDQLLDSTKKRYFRIITAQCAVQDKYSHDFPIHQGFLCI